MLGLPCWGSVDAVDADPSTDVARDAQDDRPRNDSHGLTGQLELAVRRQGPTVDRMPATQVGRTAWELLMRADTPEAFSTGQRVAWSRWPELWSADHLQDNAEKEGRGG